MRIDPATTDDVDAVTELWVALAREQRDHESHVLPEANRTRIREDFLGKAAMGQLYVARTDGNGEDDPGVVGFVSFGPKPGSFAEAVDRGLVSNLYVRPGYRDRGIGSELLSAAERQLREAGFDVVTLDAMADNRAAIGFYDRHGYGRHRVTLEKSFDADTGVDADPETEADDADEGGSSGQ